MGCASSGYTAPFAKLIAKKSKDLAYSSSNIEQFVEKFISKPFRSRGPMQADEFAGVQRMEGAKESSRKIVEDYLRRFDKIIYNIEKKAMPAARASGLTDSLASAFVKFINQGKFVVKNNKIIPQGFSTKVMNDFMKTMTKDLKIDSDDAVSLMDEFFNVQNTWADFMNIIYNTLDNRINVSLYSLHQVRRGRNNEDTYTIRAVPAHNLLRLGLHVQGRSCVV